MTATPAAAIRLMPRLSQAATRATSFRAPPPSAHQAAYDALRVRPELDLGVENTNKTLSHIGAVLVAPDNEHYEAKYGPGSFERDWPLIADGTTRLRESGIDAPFDELGPTIPFDAYVTRLTSVSATRLGARSLTAVSTEPPPPLLLDRLDPTGHTILYGTGGVGKGIYASHLIQLLVDRSGHRVLLLDYEDHPQEWSRRIQGLGGPEAREGVTHVSPLSAAWQSERGAIWDQQEDIAALSREVGATYLVIDSVVPACGGVDVGTGSTEAASKYAAALQYIGLPALSLAHVGRNNGLVYPFGSVFWHNFARVTWSLEQAADGTSVLLKNRKHNNYERQSDQMITITWLDGLPREVAERRHSTVIADLIAEVLDIEPSQSVQAITAALNADLEDEAKPYKADSISRALRRGVVSTPRRFTVKNDEWSNAA